MNNKDLAMEIVSFLDGLDDFWKELKEVVMTKFSVIGRKAQDLAKRSVTTKNDFISTIVELILYYTKSSGIFRPVTKWVLLNVVERLLGFIDKEWFTKIQNRINSIQIVDNKVINGDVVNV